MINIDDRLIKEISPKIGANALSVLLAIAIHLNQKTGRCFPSHERLMELTGMGKNAVYGALKVLKNNNLLSSEQSVNTNTNRFGRRFFRVTTRFIKIFVDAEDMEPLPYFREPEFRQPENRETEQINKYNTADSNESAVSAYSFEQFWQDYGFKRGSKAKACERFRKLAGRDLEDLRKALPLYLRETVTKEIGNQRGAEWKAKRKYPEFFLSGRIWEAYLDQAAESAAQDAVQTPHDEAYRQYLAWVNKSYPVLTAETKQLSKAQYIQYKTDYYVQGKSWMGEDMERKYLIQAHDQMSNDPIKRATYPDVFALHCEFVQRHVKNHTV